MSLESGASAEIAGVGNEGIVGISLFMGGNTTPSSAVVQTAGHGYRLERAVAEAGIQSRRPDAALVAALHPGADHADVPDRRLQSAPFGRAAAVPLAVVDARSIAVERTGHDAGTGRQHARRAPRRHYRGCRELAARRISSVTAAATLPCSSGPGLEAGACECYAVVKKELARLLSDVRYRQNASAVAA